MSHCHEVETIELPVRFDEGLLERAVLLAVERAPGAERRSFRSARDPIYEIEEPQRRERAFRALHGDWFERLGVAAPLRALLAEQPVIGRSTSACLVAPADRPRDEHADLREARAQQETARPVLVLQLLATTMVEPSRLAALLRRELLFVADMLDPAFGYDPEVAVRGTSGPFASLLRERHDLLWRVTVDGRLAARGWLADRAMHRLQARFETIFPATRHRRRAIFRALFDGPRPCHAELMRLARDPAGEPRGTSGECPLCGMAVPRDGLRRGSLPVGVIAAARRDFADWRTQDGMCPHCADLYELRERAQPTARR